MGLSAERGASSVNRSPPLAEGPLEHRWAGRGRGRVRGRGGGGAGRGGGFPSPLLQGSWAALRLAQGLASLLPLPPPSQLLAAPSLPAAQLFCQHCCLIIFQVASWSRCSGSFLHRKQTGALLSFALLGKIPLLPQILLERFRDFCEVSPRCSLPGICLQMDGRGFLGLPRCVATLGRGLGVHL